jgi:hypothetical protein
MVKTVVDIKGMANDRGTSATAAPYLSTLAGGGETLRQAKGQVTGGAGRNRTGATRGQGRSGCKWHAGKHVTIGVESIDGGIAYNISRVELPAAA